LADGTALDKATHTLSLCQSGFEHNGICTRFTLDGGKDVECSATKLCSYTDHAKAAVTIPENCLCGYNPSGKKYCKLGSASEEHQQQVTFLKSLLTTSTLCNTQERGVCNHLRVQPTKEFTDINTKLTNAKIKADNHHELIGAEKCVIKVAYPEYTDMDPTPSPSPPEPVKGTCARYQCKSKQENCASSHKEAGVINVTLSDTCDKKFHCDIGGKPNEVFYTDKDFNSKTCTANQKPLPSTVLRFPGEDCIKNEDCYTTDKVKYPDEKLVGTCVSGKCQGYKTGEACKETAWCLAGNYCEAEKCAPLKKETVDCVKTTECQNHLVCFEKKCQNKYYSQEAGTDVTGKADAPLALLCKYGKTTSKGVCDFWTSTGTIDKKSDLVSCKEGEKCNYDTKDGPQTKPCECGYNVDGLSYCPKGDNQSTDKWDKLYQWQAKKFNNKCHSESKYSCYKDDEATLTGIVDFHHQTNEAHLYYGAPDCTSKVLSSSWMKMSLFTVLAVFMIIFI